MHSMKLIAIFGLVCLVAGASAQTSGLSSLLSNTEDSGSYLVNGTGVIYDENSITMLVNGEVIQTLTRGIAPGPSPHGKDDDDKDHDKDLFHDKDDKDKDDKDKEEKDKDDDKDFPKDDKKGPVDPPTSGTPPTISPTASPDDLEAAEGGIGKDDSDPLDNIIIGRKML